MNSEACLKLGLLEVYFLESVDMRKDTNEFEGMQHGVVLRQAFWL